MNRTGHLVVDRLSAGYAGSDVIRDVSFEVVPGETLVILGPNGAGKSTLMRTIAGLVAPSSGTVTLDGEDVTAMSPERRVRQAGIVLVPEGRMLFPTLSVADHILIGRRSRGEREPVGGSEPLDLFPELSGRHKHLARNLSGGQQQMLAMLRGLLADPKLLMLDEPSLGLAPIIRLRIYRAISEQLESGNLTAVIIEQDVSLAWKVASRLLVMAGGEIRLSLDRDDVASGEQLREMYLGFEAPGGAGATRIREPESGRTEGT